MAKPSPAKPAPPDSTADAAAPAPPQLPQLPPLPRLPARIEPSLGANGQPLEQSPPVAGRWLRHADGGLAPADISTADAAGLARPG